MFITIGEFEEVNIRSIVRLGVAINDHDGYNFNVFLSNDENIIHSSYSNLSEAYEARYQFICNNTMINFVSIGIHEVNIRSIVKLLVSRNDNDLGDECFDFNVSLSNNDEITHSSYNLSDDAYHARHQFISDNTSINFISIGDYEVNPRSIARIKLYFKTKESFNNFLLKL